MNKELKQAYEGIGVNTDSFRDFGEMNVCVQLFGHDPDEDYEGPDIYEATNYMPRKDYIGHQTFDLSTDEGKENLKAYLADSIERMKIAAHLMQKQLNELSEKGTIETTFYYYEL